MDQKTYKVKEVARLAKVTVRALHHYDSLGLLVPSARSAAGYRLYSEQDLLRLQQILLWRQLGLPLEQIRRILDDPGFDRRAALRAQRERLAREVLRTDAMIRSIDTALQVLEGESNMDASKLFDGFDPTQYEREVEERWGKTDEYAESARRTKKYTREDWGRIQREAAQILDELADAMRGGVAASAEEATELAERHRLHIDRWYYPCSRAMHASLADMYESDERFAAHFEKQGEGLTAYLVEAIRTNLDRQ